MPPPKLAADGPVAEVLVPGLERLGVASGEEAELALPVAAAFIGAVRRSPLSPALSPQAGRGKKRFVLFGVEACLGRAFELVVGHGEERRAGEALVRHLAVPLVAQVRLD